MFSHTVVHLLTFSVAFANAQAHAWHCGAHATTQGQGEATAVALWALNLKGTAAFAGWTFPSPWQWICLVAKKSPEVSLVHRCWASPKLDQRGSGWALTAPSPGARAKPGDASPVEPQALPTPLRGGVTGQGGHGPECCCMWSNRRSQSSDSSTSAPGSSGACTKWMASAPRRVTRSTGMSPMRPRSSGCGHRESTPPPQPRPPARPGPARTCPPPSGKRIVSSSTTSNPCSGSPPPSGRSSAAWHDTTLVANCNGDGGGGVSGGVSTDPRRRSLPVPPHGYLPGPAVPLAPEHHGSGGSGGTAHGGTHRTQHRYGRRPRRDMGVAIAASATPAGGARPVPRSDTGAIGRGDSSERQQLTFIALCTARVTGTGTPDNSRRPGLGSTALSRAPGRAAPLPRRALPAFLSGAPRVFLRSQRPRGLGVRGHPAGGAG